MLESLLSTYGYPIIIIGTFLEGEIIMALGGVSAVQMFRGANGAGC
jgi:hypothetical protein